MGNRTLTTKEISKIQTETQLSAHEITRAFDRFKALAGDKGYVAKRDLAPLLREIPIREEVLQVCVASSPLSGDQTEIDFEALL